MARNGRVNASTIAKFIAPDDSAIGIEDVKEFKEAYDQYLRTGDHRHLKLKSEEKPAWYFVRPYLHSEKTEIRDYFASLLAVEGAEEGKELDSEVLAEAVHKADPTIERFDLLRRSVVYNCIIGCVDHPIVEDEVGDDGQLVVRHVRWEVGTPEPVGLRESMMKDPLLSTILFQYLFAISSLTEKEKN